MAERRTDVLGNSQNFRLRQRGSKTELSSESALLLLKRGSAKIPCSKHETALHPFTGLAGCEGVKGYFVICLYLFPFLLM